MVKKRDRSTSDTRRTGQTFDGFQAGDRRSWPRGGGHPGPSSESDNREFVGAVSEVTERKVAGRKLHEQEVELKQILDFTPQLVSVFGPHRERLYANRVVLD